MAQGSWHMAHGIRHTVHGIRYTVHGVFVLAAVGFRRLLKK